MRGRSFTGIRTDHDVIISMDFLQGGGLGSVTVRTWDGNEYVQGRRRRRRGLLLESSPDAGGCSICAFNNGDDIDGGPWPNYDSHGDPITLLEQNAFTEMGVDGSPS